MLKTVKQNIYNSSPLHFSFAIFHFLNQKKSSILLAICLHQSDFISWHLSNHFLTLAALLLCDLSLQSSCLWRHSASKHLIIPEMVFQSLQNQAPSELFQSNRIQWISKKKSQKIRNYHRKRTNHSYTNLNIKTTFYEKQHYICTVVETYQWVYLSIFKVYWKQFKVYWKQLRGREARLN